MMRERDVLDVLTLLANAALTSWVDGGLASSLMPWARPGYPVRPNRSGWRLVFIPQGALCFFAHATQLSN
jgi:hypothetical protein